MYHVSPHRLEVISY